MKNNIGFYGFLALFGVSVLGLVQAMGGGYYQLLAFYVLQYVVLATAWNILGGYGGYVNFGSAGFFAVGAYSTVFFFKWLGLKSLTSFDWLFIHIDLIEWDR